MRVAASLQRLGEAHEWRQPDAPRHHPRFRRWIDWFERSAKRSETGDPHSGFDLVQQPGADADAFVQQRDADRRSVRVAQRFEDREGAAEQRIAFRAMASPSQTARAARAPRSPAPPARARCSARTAGCCGSPRLRCRRASDEVYTSGHAVPAHADQRAACRRARCSVSDRDRVAVEHARANRLGNHGAMVSVAWPLLRHLPRGRVLSVDGGAGILQPGNPVARLGQRARARVDDRSDGGSGRRVDVAERGRLRPRAERNSHPPDDRRRRGDDRCGRRPSRDCRGALLVGPARQQGRRRALRDRRIRFARAADCRARARVECAPPAERHDSCRSSRCRRRAASLDVVARRCIARIHPPACGGRAAPEFFALARYGSDARSRHRPAYGARFRVGVGRHRNVSGQNGRAVRCQLFCAWQSAAHRSAPGSLFLARPGAPRDRPSRGERRHRVAQLAAVEHPQRRRHSGGPRSDGR